MKFVKIVGIAMLILVATVGGAALRLLEIFNSSDPLPLPRAERAENLGSAGSADVGAEEELAVGEGENTSPTIASARGTVNILVVGLDNVDGGSRTDAIALAIFDADNRALRIASIPRDSRVYIPRKGWDKINHAYVYGGINLLRETVVNLTGVPVDYFVKINYQSFPRIVDLLGGVDIYVDKRLHYTDYSGKLFINIPKGQQHMNGKTALGYVRFRHDPLGDIGRVQRQQKFMNIMMDKLKTPAIIPKIPALIDEVINAVDTDLTPLDALRLLQFANSLPSDRVRMFMAPGKSGYSGKLSYWILDNVAFSMQLAAKLPPSDESTTPAPQTPDGSKGKNETPLGGGTGEGDDSDRVARLCQQVGRIRILNGDGANGLGKRAAQLFQRIGIEVPYTGNARHYDYHTTNIIYPPGADEDVKQGAKALAELCGIDNPGLIRENRAAESLTLILGHDKETIFKRLSSLKL
ncbi:MAG: LCP family protein [Synergistaceae bacterium]|nr:LCP family protein [Synergistaceae bacterium]